MDIEIKVPDIGIDKVEVIEILVQVNDCVVKEQSLIVVEGEKASMEIPSPYSGVIKDIKVNISDLVQTDTVIILIDTSDVDKTLKPAVVNNSVQPIMHNVIDQQERLIHASPLVRRLARSLKINLNNILGTGRKNRILKEDINNYILKINKKIHDDNVSPNVDDTKNIHHDFHRFGTVEAVKINKIKEISGNTLFKNWSTIPHVTQFDEVDITDLEEFRKQYNSENQDTVNSKLTMLSFLVRAIGKGLCKFPYFNSSISSDNKTIFLKKYINIGIAVDTDVGLLVPVIKDIKNKSVLDISNEIFNKSQQARQGKLNILDVQGGCFTISSLGGIGGTAFSPIINAPEAAILGVSKATHKPIWTGKEFIPRLILPLSLSYNHRIIDGADGVKFISFINHLLSHISLLLI